MYKLFETGGKWYKGNLHMHTTLSDGNLSPDAATSFYKMANYDFVALTDHWVQSEQKIIDGMLFLNGCEFDTGDMVNYPIFHIVGIGMESHVSLRRLPSRNPQEIIDAITSVGGVAILAHPAWSITNPADCLALTGLSGAEIYNTVSGLPWNSRPDSSLYFDIWASQGKLFNCIAADDSHFYKGEQTRSFIMVKAKELSADSIKKALASGEFYASQGPQFKSVTIKDNVIEVTCSQVETVIFYSNTIYCSDRVKTGGTTFARYKIKPTDKYLRIELIDSNGNRAWGSPFFVNSKQNNS